MKDLIQLAKANPDLTYITVIIIVLLVERWLGRTLKIKEASILDILLARVLRIPLPEVPEPKPPVEIKDDQAIRVESPDRQTPSQP